MSFIAWIILGAGAGFIGTLLTGEGGGLLQSIIVGVIGAVIGGWLFNYLGFAGVTGFNFYSLFVAGIGAAILLLIADFIT